MKNECTESNRWMSYSSCLNCEPEEKSLIEILNFEAEEVLESITDEPMIIFLQKGEIQLSTEVIVNQTIEKDRLFLLSSGSHVFIRFVEATSLLFCRLRGKIQFCEMQKPEDLYKTENKEQMDLPLITSIEINEPVALFFHGVIETFNYGLRCRFYMESKCNELLILIRNYYSTELLADFFSPLFTRDTAFKTRVLAIGNEAVKVKDLAALSYSSVTGFRRRFKKALGTTPMQWKNEERKKRVWYELKMTDKSLKQICEECGFQSISYFNEFCRKHFGETPGKIRR
jgi:AraC-like DNA-binding protein